MIGWSGNFLSKMLVLLLVMKKLLVDLKVLWTVKGVIIITFFKIIDSTRFQTQFFTDITLIAGIEKPQQHLLQEGLLLLLLAKPLILKVPLLLL